MRVTPADGGHSSRIGPISSSVSPIRRSMAASSAERSRSRWRVNATTSRGARLARRILRWGAISRPGYDLWRPEPRCDPEDPRRLQCDQLHIRPAVVSKISQVVRDTCATSTYVRPPSPW